MSYSTHVLCTLKGNLRWLQMFHELQNNVNVHWKSVSCLWSLLASLIFCLVLLKDISNCCSGAKKLNFGLSL